ncbi:MAG: glycerophosphodiester phosphodiesterase [Nocardioides sp.]
MRLTTRPSSGPLPSPRTRGVATVAHRGASWLAPENTLAAVRAAVRSGAEHVEVDVQRTRDGALVVVHDTTLARTTDAARVLGGSGPWRVGDVRLDQVRRLDAGAWHHPAYGGEPLPLLAEVVDALAGTGTGLLLEVKAPHLYPGIEADVAAELRGCPVPLVVQSFDHRVMRSFKDLAPEVPVGLLGAVPRRRLKRLADWADQLNPRHRAVGAAYVEAVHEAGMRCQVWTVDDPADLARAVAMGVDGVITNRPDRLLDLLGSRVPSVA